MDEEIMICEEMKLVSSVVDGSIEIWVELTDGNTTPITDYDYDLKNNRIILRVKQKDKQDG